MVTIYILPSTFLRIRLNFLTFTLFSFRCSTVSTNLSRHVNRICVPLTFVSVFSALSTEGGQKVLLRVWEKNLWSALLTVSYFFCQFTQVRPLLYHHAALFYAIIVWNQLHICEFIFRLILEQLPLSERFHIVHCATAKLLLCRLFFLRRSQYTCFQLLFYSSFILPSSVLAAHFLWSLFIPNPMFLSLFYFTRLGFFSL